MDDNGNGVDDELESFTLPMIYASGNHVDVIVQLDHPPTEADFEAFNALGGEVTNVYEYAIEGYSGSLPMTSGPNLADGISGFVVIEKNRPIELHIDNGTRQMRVRNTIWDSNGYLGGFRGNSTSAVAVLDTGIDDAQKDLYGYSSLG